MAEEGSVRVGRTRSKQGSLFRGAWKPGSQAGPSHVCSEPCRVETAVSSCLYLPTHSSCLMLVAVTEQKHFTGLAYLSGSEGLWHSLETSSALLLFAPSEEP